MVARRTLGHFIQKSANDAYRRRSQKVVDVKKPHKIANIQCNSQFSALALTPAVDHAIMIGPISST